MIKLIKENGIPKVGVYEIMVDTADEVEDLDDLTYPQAGSTALCIENSKTYMLNSSGEWTEVNFNNGSGGGSGSGDIGICLLVYDSDENDNVICNKTFAEIKAAIENYSIFYAIFTTEGENQISPNMAADVAEVFNGTELASIKVILYSRSIYLGDIHISATEFSHNVDGTIEWKNEYSYTIEKDDEG